MTKFLGLVLAIMVAGQAFAQSEGSPAHNSVAEQMKKTQFALGQWSKQKTLFYIFDLAMSEEELSNLDKTNEEIGIETHSIVNEYYQTSPLISEQEFIQKFTLAMSEYDEKVLDIMGPDRLDEAKKFRAVFNEKLSAKVNGF